MPLPAWSLANHIPAPLHPLSIDIAEWRARNTATDNCHDAQASGYLRFLLPVPGTATPGRDAADICLAFRVLYLHATEWMH